MIMSSKSFNSLLTILMVGLSLSLGLNPAQAEEIDVSYLQSCLKTDGSSLDVLVLMDSSKSLRDKLPGEQNRVNDKGSDPLLKRGPILKSSLQLLATLAEDSGRDFNVSLRNFGANSDPKELQALSAKWVDWSDGSEEENLAKLVENALYDDSPGTQWASGLATAKKQFEKRVNEARLAGTQSCGIMFWITDGAPSDSTSPICSDNSDSSISWFRQNQILVLGGLLKPSERNEAEIAKQFGPLVRGETCGRTDSNWTQGEVIEANNVSDLAWQFVGLVAGIKNLIDLRPINSSFEIDPSTAHIEIFLKSDKKNWEIKTPDGKVFCSSSSQNSRCIVDPNSEIGITTVTIFPEQPTTAAGRWTVSPQFGVEDIQVFGGLNTSSPKAAGTQPRLLIDSPNPASAEEGKSKSFAVKLVNADGSAFSPQGFKTITICAKVESQPQSSCANGASTSNLSVNPITTDKSVSFEATLISSFDDDRKYRIAASVGLNVIQSGLFPTLLCEKSSCEFQGLKNSKDISENILEVKSAENGVAGGSLTILGFAILSDEIEARGNKHFTFRVERTNGEIVDWMNSTNPLAAGEKFKVIITTDISGKSPVQGLLKYKVSAQGQDVERQVLFKFQVENAQNRWIQILLTLLAYLITLGLPYLFLLWSARRQAVLQVSDGQFAYLEQKISISEGGKISIIGGLADEAASASTTPSVKDLRFQDVEENSRSISVGNVSIEVSPPRWNPFVEPEVQVVVLGSHVLSTFGSPQFFPQRNYFSRDVTGEAAIYFETDANLAPVKHEEELMQESSADSGIFSENSISSTDSVLRVKTGDITATALYFVPRFGNWKKSLEEVILKTRSVTDGASLENQIESLRKEAFEVEKVRIEEARLASLAESGKKKTPRAGTDKASNVSAIEKTDGDKNQSSFFEDELESRGKSLFSDDSDPDDWNSGKSWN